MALRRSRLTRNTIANPRRVIETQLSVTKQVAELYPVWKAHHDRMVILDKWATSDLDEDMLPIMPNEATDEFKAIRNNAPTPWGQLIIGSMSQVMYVDDIKLASGLSAPAYDLWQRNGLDSRQIPLHEGALTFGQAYNLVLPARGRMDGQRTAMIRGKSALTSLAFYRDDFDEYPRFFLECVGYVEDEKPMYRVTFVDEDAVHYLHMEQDDTSTLVFESSERHPMQLCPIVRFPNVIDLTGRVRGEIAPFVQLFGRINQDTQDRLVVQRKGAWAVRTIAGMKQPATPEQQQAARIALGVGDFMVSEDKDTKFGSLPPTPLDGYIRSREADIRDLAATSQTPAHHLLGLSDNVGAEGLAAAEASMMRKRDHRRINFGESHEVSLRLGGWAAGIEEVATDYTSRVHWKDTETQSFQSLAQALGVLVSQVGMPPEMAFEKIPDWTQVDINRAIKLLEKAKAEAQLEADLATERQIQVQAAKGEPGGDAPAAG